MAFDYPMTDREIAEFYMVKVRDMRDENARLREALEFYADDSRYVTQYDSDFNGRTNAYTPIKEDKGNTAREALGNGEESNSL